MICFFLRGVCRLGSQPKIEHQQNGNKEKNGQGQDQRPVGDWGRLGHVHLGSLRSFGCFGRCHLWRGRWRRRLGRCGHGRHGKRGRGHRWGCRFLGFACGIRRGIHTLYRNNFRVGTRTAGGRRRDGSGLADRARKCIRGAGAFRGRAGRCGYGELRHGRTGRRRNRKNRRGGRDIGHWRWRSERFLRGLGKDGPGIDLRPRQPDGWWCCAGGPRGRLRGEPSGESRAGRLVSGDSFVRRRFFLLRLRFHRAEHGSEVANVFFRRLLGQRWRGG